MRAPFGLVIALSALSLSACKGDDPAEKGDSEAPLEEVYSDCDPVAPTLCGLPFPSTFYMKEDSGSPTGWRVNLGETTLPLRADIDGVRLQPAPTYWNERDGWSVGTPMLAHFPSLSLDNVVGHDRLADSLLDDSTTIVIDVNTGERVAHWGELDVSLGKSDRSLFMIRPAAAFEYGHRYVVAMRALKDEAGADIEPSEAFAALRDGGATDTWDVEGRRATYDEVVFPALEAQGWARGEVQLAWDFVTGSQEGITGKAVFMRDDALAQLGEGSPAYTIDEVIPLEDTYKAFEVHGTLTVPLYTEEDGPGTVLTRGDDGMPYQNGETHVPFTVIVPRSLVDGAKPGAIVQYGHGLLGAQDEVGAGYLGEIADRYGWIIIAVDWTGMKEGDAGQISLMLVNDLGGFAMLPERCQQGFVEFTYAMRLASKGLVNDPVFQVTDSAGATVSLIDPERRYYYGNSQGGILGGAYMALSQDIERGTLGVGGGPYQLLLTRSKDFEPFFLLFQQMYPDPADVALWLGYLQTLWDSAETTGFARSLTANPLPNTNAKQVLMQVGIGDAQVTTLGAELLARSTGSTLINEPVRPVWGMETVVSTTTGSGLVEWEYGLEEPYTNTPPSEDQADPHEWPRREFNGQEQMAHFFATGEIKDFCGGPCQDLTHE